MPDPPSLPGLRPAVTLETYMRSWTKRYVFTAIASENRKKQCLFVCKKFWKLEECQRYVRCQVNAEILHCWEPLPLIACKLLRLICGGTLSGIYTMSCYIPVHMRKIWQLHVWSDVYVIKHNISYHYYVVSSDNTCSHNSFKLLNWL